MQKLVLKQTRERVLGMIASKLADIITLHEQQQVSGKGAKEFVSQIVVDSSLNVFMNDLWLPQTFREDEIRFVIGRVNQVTRNVSFPDVVFDPDSIADVEIAFAGE